MSTEEEIAKILSPAIDARAPYAKVMIGMLARLVTAEREASAEIADNEAVSAHDPYCCIPLAKSIAEKIRNRT